MQHISMVMKANDSSEEANNLRLHQECCICSNTGHLGKYRMMPYNMELYPLTLPMQSTINEAIHTYVPSYASFMLWNVFIG